MINQARFFVKIDNNFTIDDSLFNIPDYNKCTGIFTSEQALENYDNCAEAAGYKGNILFAPYIPETPNTCTLHFANHDNKIFNSKTCNNIVSLAFNSISFGDSGSWDGTNCTYAKQNIENIDDCKNLTDYLNKNLVHINANSWVASTFTEAIPQIEPKCIAVYEDDISISNYENCVASVGPEGLAVFVPGVGLSQGITYNCNNKSINYNYDGFTVSLLNDSYQNQYLEFVSSPNSQNTIILGGDNGFIVDKNNALGDHYLRVLCNAHTNEVHTIDLTKFSAIL